MAVTNKTMVVNDGNSGKPINADTVMHTNPVAPNSNTSNKPNSGGGSTKEHVITVGTAESALDEIVGKIGDAINAQGGIAEQANTSPTVANTNKVTPDYSNKPGIAAVGTKELPTSTGSQTTSNQATQTVGNSAGSAVAGAIGSIAQKIGGSVSTGAQGILNKVEESASNGDISKKPDSGTPGSGGTSGGPGGGGGGGTPSDSTTGGEDAGGTPATPASNAATAAETTRRIVNGVDMSGQIAEANDAWSEINKNYEETSQGLINDAGQQMNENVDQYAEESKQIIDQLKGISEEAIANYAASTGQTIEAVKAQINDILAGLEGLGDAQAGRVDRVDTVEQENLLAQIIDAARQQQIGQIDYTTQQGITELQRAEEDAAPQFQTMRNQIAANEQTALDNQALYAEMRGDRGGIGQAQYGSIQNTAATNQLTVNREQTKLSTDTARQIADLRAQGEFKKADALLELTQSYLSQLMQLKQWAAETNVGIDEFNIGVEQWEEEFRMKAKEILANTSLAATEYLTDLEMQNQKDITDRQISIAEQNANLNLDRAGTIAEQRQNITQYLTELGVQNAQYMSDSQINQISKILNNYMQNAQNLASTEISAANLTGAFSDATPTAAMAEATREQLANAAASLVAAGVTPTDAQLEAMGWTKEQYNAYAALQKAASSGGGGTSSKLLKEVQQMVANGASVAEVAKKLSDYGYAYGNTEPQKVMDILTGTGFFAQGTGSSSGTSNSGSSKPNSASSAVGNTGNSIASAIADALGLPNR